MGVAQCRYVDQVGIVRMDAYLGDVTRVRQAEVRPGLTCVGRFIDAVAMRDVAANGCLAHANVDDVRVRGGDGYRANRGAFEKAIGDVFPDQAAIDGFPDTAARRAEIKYLRVLRVSADGDDAATAERTDQPPFKRIEQVWIDSSFLNCGIGDGRRLSLPGLL